MTITPHPIVLTAAGEQRRVEIEAQVGRERLARRATGDGIAQQTGLAVPALRMMAELLPVLLSVARPH
jgi:hypothetical protein